MIMFRTRSELYIELTEANVLFNDALSRFLFTVIWRLTHGILNFFIFFYLNGKECR